MLGYLKTFATLARERHFARSASLLGISQSAVSRQLVELEALTGFSLFKRSTRSVELTAAGERFLRAVVGGLGMIEDGLTEAAQVAGGKRGLVRLGYTRLSMLRLGAAAIGALRTQYPDMTLELHEMGTNAQVEALLAGQLDLGLLHPPLPTAELRLDCYDEDGTVLVAATNHPQAHGNPVALATLRDAPMIFYPRAIGPVLYDQMTKLCLDAGFVARIVQHCTSWEAAIDLAANHLGIAWVPRRMALHRASEVAIIETREPLPRLPFAIATRRADDRLIRSIADRLKRHACPIPEAIGASSESTAGAH